MKELKPIYADFIEMSDPVEILKYARELLGPAILKEVNENGLKTDTAMRLMSADHAILKVIGKLGGLEES